MADSEKVDMAKYQAWVGFLEKKQSTHEIIAYIQPGATHEDLQAAIDEAREGGEGPPGVDGTVYFRGWVEEEGRLAHIPPGTRIP